jgi:hypothetical protein
VFESIDDILHAVHAFFEHAAAVYDAPDAIHGHVTSIADLHHQITESVQTIPHDDIVSITDAFAQHLPHNIAQHLAGTAYHGDINAFDQMVVGRQAAANTLALLNDPQMNLSGEYSAYIPDTGTYDALTATDAHSLERPWHQVRFSGICYHCGGRGTVWSPGSGTTKCWFCDGSGVLKS